MVAIKFSKPDDGVALGLVLCSDSNVVLSVTPGTVGNESGFLEGMKVVSINGRDVANEHEFFSVYSEIRKGQRVTVGVESPVQTLDIG